MYQWLQFGADLEPSLSECKKFPSPQEHARRPEKQAGAISGQLDLDERAVPQESWQVRGVGLFNLHRQKMKELWIVAVLGLPERPNLAHNLFAYRNHWKKHPVWCRAIFEPFP